MNYSMIRYILAWVFTFEGIFLMLPAIVGGIYGEKQGLVYLAIAAGCLLVGTLSRIRKIKSKVFYSKEGFAAVSLSWIIMSLVGALPFFITGEIPAYEDALFETISGFTTTGSSILSNVEALTHCSLFWRSFTHWSFGIYYGSSSIIRWLNNASYESGKSGPGSRKTCSESKTYSNDFIWNIHCVYTC